MYFRLMFALAALLLSVACNSPANCTKKVVDERDVYIYFTAEEKRAEPIISEAKEIRKIKKILSERDFIFLSEEKEGIHVIDNSKPKEPKILAFLEIKGNWDMSIKGNILYADSYSDLLIFDVSNAEKPKLIRRLNDVFNWDNVIGRFKNAGLEKEMVKEVKHIKKEYIIACNDEIDFVNKNNNNTVNNTANNGSMTRFCRHNNFLYAVDELDLYVFDLRNPLNPSKVNTMRVDDRIETLYAYNKRLFIGGLQGVYMYDISDPGKPQQLDIFKHVESCDPVIIDDSIAYATTREESECRRGKNALFVLNVSDFETSELIAEFSMQHPHGIAVKKNRIYVAEGEYGLKVFSTLDKKDIANNFLIADSTIHAFDLIASKEKNLLMLSGNDGFFQYDISNPDSLKRIGEIRAK